MEICEFNQQKNYVIAVNRTCISENKTKSNCGCKIILPVIGFECYLCKVFIRNETDIEDHVASIPHLKIYEIHMQDHNKVQDSMNSNQNNVNGQCLDDGITSFANDVLIECNANENLFERNSVNGNCPGENDNAGSNKKDPQLKETDFGGIDREWSKSIRGKSNKTEIAQNMVYDTRISTIYAHLKMQNINANLSENQAQPRNGQVQDTFGNVKKRHFEKSDSDQVDHNINECCNTLINGEEMECRFWEGQVKLEDIDVNDVEVNGYVSTSTEHKRENDQCRNVSGFFEANKETFHETFVKEEEYDDYDDNGGDAGGIIGGFLEDKIDDLDDDEHYDGELVTGYTSDHKPQTESLRPFSAAISTCNKQLQPTVSSPSARTQKSDETSEKTNSEEISESVEGINVEVDRRSNSNINTCISTEHPQKEPNQRSRKTPPPAMPITPRNSDKGDLHTDKTTQSSDKCRTEESYPTSSTVGTVCDKDFTTATALKRHASIHTTEKPSSCVVYGKLFNTDKHIELHQLTHTGDKVYSCRVCSKSFNLLGDLKVHKMIHTGEKTFSCAVCKKEFTQSSDLEKHQLVHTTEKPFSCDVCGKAFAYKYLFNRHKRIHTVEKPFSCDVCGKAFSYRSKFDLHKRTHTGEKPFSCDACGKAFTDNSTLYRHKRRHTGKKPFSCDACGKAFADNSTLYKHKLIHAAEKPFSCDVCGNAFADSNNLNRHKRIHTVEKPFSCDVCGKAFAYRSKFDIHKRTHTGEKPFSCDACGKAFTDNSTLYKHKRIHTGEKPFSCDACGKAFADNSTLYKHKRIHSREKAFSCDACGKVFAQSNNLKRHKQIHAREKQFPSGICG